MEESIALFFWGMRDTQLFDIFNTISGKTYIILTCAPFIVLSFIKFKKKALTFLAAATIAVTASDIICHRVLKPTIKRLRPAYELNLSDQKTSIRKKANNDKAYSMPSNHASNIFAFFVAYLLLAKRFWGLLFVNSFLIAASRVVIVKHYPSDVIAGMTIGSLIAIITVRLISFSKLERVEPEQ